MIFICYNFKYRNLEINANAGERIDEHRKIRNSKSEIRNKFKLPKYNIVSVISD